ncbi:MAG: HAMP domain-containing histidine kinase [Notoacmeibacter sp.]|nr:HAMP domain-containing histidine kinase [Notoacmeibacter sp.]MCC0027734.1 HAMP domain-containing histidine kinase [Brucellaceae bacterium]
MFEKIAKSYMALVEYFIPPELRMDREACNQARMFLISHTMGPILGNTVPLALFLVDPTPGMDTFWLAVSITGFWVFPFLLKRGFNYDWLVVISVLNLNFCIFWSCYYNGGVASPTLPWVLIIPLLSFFYIGGEQRLQSALLAIFALCFSVFLAIYTLTAPPANDVPAYAMTSLGIVSTLACFAYVATMAIYYSRIFDAGVELENEVRRRRQASDELRQAVANADRVGRMKAEFLARMSHELRTPLNAVIGYSQLLKEEAIDMGDMQMTRDVDKIHDAGQYLLRLINMILDLSNIEAGRMQFRQETWRLADLVSMAVEGARPVITGNGNAVEFYLEPGVDDVETDRERMIQIFDAILRNAGENTRNGVVSVTCRLRETAAGKAYAVEIRDTGRGIARERLKTLFQTLIDTRDASQSKYGGTGLNLTITYRLAEAMGCTLAVESEEGKGSAFTVTIPALWHMPDEAPVTGEAPGTGSSAPVPAAA